MSKPEKNVIAIVLNAHKSLIPCPEKTFSVEESSFFTAVSETYIPLLQMFDRLYAAHTPFRLGIVLAPELLSLLDSAPFTRHYLEYLNAQIQFGEEEKTRYARDEARLRLAEHWTAMYAEKKRFLCGRCKMNLLSVFKRYEKTGSIEIMLTTAAPCFLPFFTAYTENSNAQIESAASVHKQIFKSAPQGFWLPELAWCAGLDKTLLAHGYAYSIIDTHTAILGNPPAEKGSFYPLNTKAGLTLLVRDYYAVREIEPGTGGDTGAPAFMNDSAYRDNREDAGFEYPRQEVSAFMTREGARLPTGFKYYRRREGAEARTLYNPEAAQARAKEHAKLFLENRLSRFVRAAAHMNEAALSLCAIDADSAGVFWHEGMCFLENLITDISGRDDVALMTPKEYLGKQDAAAFQTVSPEYSSSGWGGYAGSWLDSSNDWIYRHLIQGIVRMIELARRFPNATGLAERVLNQACREILFAQSSLWPRMIFNGENASGAANRIKTHLRNFTAFYEALGSDHVDTRLLTTLEQNSGIFASLSYRIFRPKKN